MSRRGMSTVVSTVLVIAISVILAVIVGYGIKQFTEVSLGPATACTQLAINPSFSIQKVCYNSARKDLEITVHRSFDDRSIEGFYISTQTSSGTSGKWSCTDACGTCTLLSNGETKTYYFGLDEMPLYAGLESNGCSLEQKPVENC